MRVLAACLTVVLGLGAGLTLAACSDSTDSGSGGAGGASGASNTPTGGAGTGGATSHAGAGGEAGAADCSFQSNDCQSCIGTKCMNEAGACIADSTCATPLLTLEGCACDGTSTIDECKSAFTDKGGSSASKLVTCYNTNCKSTCEK